MHAHNYAQFVALIEAGHRGRLRARFLVRCRVCIRYFKATTIDARRIINWNFRIKVICFVLVSPRILIIRIFLKKKVRMNDRRNSNEIAIVSGAN